MRIACAILAALVATCYGLTDHEIKQFHNSGKYGGNVTVVTSSNGNMHTIYSNGLPDHPTERVNPNHPQKQHFNFHVKKHATKSETPGCLPMGPIGIARTGVAIFDPFTNEGENAVEGAHREIFDSCDGHPDIRGVYHYHKIPDSCLYEGRDDEFIGVALDGYPIYGPKASDLGREVTEADLDECHGRVVNGRYRYHVTNTFPYYLGCFRGSGIHNRVSYNCDTSKASDGNYVCPCPKGEMGQMNHQQGGQLPSGFNGEHQLMPTGNPDGHMPRPSGHMPTGPGGHLPTGDPLHLHRTGTHMPHRPYHPHHLPPWDPFGKKK